MRYESVVITPLDPNMHGPEEFAVVSEPKLIELGYRFHFAAFNGAGECVRVGTSKLATEAEVLAYVISGQSRLEWESQAA